MPVWVEARVARGAVFDVNRLAQVSVFELLYTLLNIIEYLKQTVGEKGKHSSNTIYAFCRNSELIANLFNYCTQLNRVLTVEDSIHYLHCITKKKAQSN